MRYEAVRPERSVAVAVAVDGGVDVNFGRPVSLSGCVCCVRVCMRRVFGVLVKKDDGRRGRRLPSVGVVVDVDVKVKECMSVSLKRLQQNHPLLGETKLTPGPCLSMGCKPEMRGGPSEIDQLIRGGVNNGKRLYPVFRVRRLSRPVALVATEKGESLRRDECSDAAMFPEPPFSVGTFR